MKQMMESIIIITDDHSFNTLAEAIFHKNVCLHGDSNPMAFGFASGQAIQSPMPAPISLNFPKINNT
jgi:hypothetical protein